MIPKAIFFDWDGTLVDSYSFLEQAHNYVRGIFGDPPLPHKKFYEFFGQPREVVYTALYGPRSEEAKIHFREWINKHAHLLKPAAGAEELLRTAHGMGITLGVVTNKAPDIVGSEIKLFGWEPFMAALVGAGEARKDKPSGAPLMLAIQRTGMKPEMENIWYVGDTETDMRCAADVGCPSIFLTGENNQLDWLNNYKPLLIKENCAGIAEFLLQISGKLLKTTMPD